MCINIFFSFSFILFLFYFLFFSLVHSVLFLSVFMSGCKNIAEAAGMVNGL